MALPSPAPTLSRQWVIRATRFPGKAGRPIPLSNLRPGAGVSYTAWGYYGLLFLDVEITFIYYDNSYEATADGWDPWDYSYYEENPEDCPIGDCSWDGIWAPAVYVVAYAVDVGEDSSNSVTADDPTYAVVMSDNTGQDPSSGNEERVTTYQVHNANGSVASGISVGENFSATNWSCTNKPQPATSTTSCSSPWVTDSNGQYPDIWED